MEILESAALRVGDRVRVRRQRWIITDVHPFEQASVVTLSGLGPANHGVEQRVVCPFDRIEKLNTRCGFRIVRPARWRRRCRQLVAEDGPAGMLLTPQTARIDLMPHQLEPALAVVRGLGSRVMIADEVGLGKTIQAALITSELKVRNAAARVLVLTPAGLRDQWIDEFRSRFGLDLALFDTATVARRRGTLPVGVSPWSIEPQIIASIDYVKRPEVLPAVSACRWDVVIIDEAHHVSAGTDRRDAIGSLCERAAYVLLLTATPHDGDSKAFASLCALGQRQQDSILVFRRGRAEIGARAPRRIHRLRVTLTPSEQRMHEALDAFVGTVERDHGSADRGTLLGISTLQKRALSSAFALARSVERRLIQLRDDGMSESQLTLPLVEAAGEFDHTDDVPAWTVPPLREPVVERELLTKLAHAAEAASGRESKLIELGRLLRRVREPALVFTEYRDTLLHLRNAIAPGCPVIHGGLSRDERRLAIRQFAAARLLLSTDAGGEGLNLQHGCRLVVNLELPWNPMRLEQRIGRVDRIGQNRRVHVFHLIARRTREIQILDRLRGRVELARAEADGPDPLGNNTEPIGSNDSRFVRLKDEAAAEYTRLVFVRQVGTPADAAASPAEDRSRALILFSKRHQLRAQIGRNILIVFRASLRDETGRAAAAHLTAVVVAGRTEGVTLASLVQLTQRAAVRDHRLTEWLEHSTRYHDAFWQRRRFRELAIAAASNEIRLELQPGLFDLRAEHAGVLVDDQRRARLLEAEQQRLTIERLSRVSLQPPEPVLILFPGRK